jgi:hypothetical protein
MDLNNLVGNFPDTEISLSAIGSTGHSSAYLSTFSTGESTGIPTKLNKNSAILELVSYFGQANGILDGLAVTDNGTQIQVAPGFAVIGALVEKVDIQSFSRTSQYLFLRRDGVVVSGISATPPINSIRIAQIIMVGNTAVISDFYVIRIIQGDSICKVPINGIPTEDYSSEIVKTYDGIWKFVDGEYFPIHSLESPGPLYVSSGQSKTTSADFEYTNIYVGGEFSGI